MLKYAFSLLSIMCLLAACNTSKSLVQGGDVLEVRELDTLVITPRPGDDDPIEDYAVSEDYQLPVYRAAYHRTHDLLHTILRLRFDWEKEQVMGQATLDLTPLASPSNQLRLDAKGFEFKSIQLLPSKQNLNYTYEGDKQEVFIQLDKTYQPGEKYSLFIDYIATPEASGGSAAITSDKGLFFINPRGEEGDKPQQIWTQGETENNSRWFPTIDKPNERCTQEMYITVEDRFKTLSNGLLLSSTKNNDGTRTDYWKMDLPHAPYLFMLAIGEFSVIEDEKWNGIPVDYYVEEKYAPYAKDIFPYTPEMLTFFSELTGVKYPWAKYSQVVVRDYVSGAMENTTGVIFGEFMYGDDRELMDVDVNEKIVAHEMFHHWFGDYVTCESWSNLTLNEGFANYSEYLWMEQKHGRDAADAHLLDEWDGYFSGLQRGGEPHELIWTDYDDKEEMFDAHSYNKGGSVLHMLRYYLGDDIFFEAINQYLVKNQYSPVEVEQLRLAFEAASGQDLHWFFNQWFHKAGHPRLELTYGYSPETREAYIDVKQVQTTRYNVPAIFQLPVAVDVYTNGSVIPERHQVMINQRSQRLTFPARNQPDVIIFDAEHVLLAEVKEERSPEEHVSQFKYGQRLLDRIFPLKYTALQGEEEALAAILPQALEDSFHGVRLAALQAMPETLDENWIPTLRKMAAEDPNSEVRVGALLILSANADSQVKTLATAALQARSYNVVGAGLQALNETAPLEALQEAAKLENVDNDNLLAAIGELYSSSGDLDKLRYFNEKMNTVDNYGSLGFFSNFTKLLASADEATQDDNLAKIIAVAQQKNSSPWRKIATYKAYADTLKSLRRSMDEESIANSSRLANMAEQLKIAKENEQDEQIKGIFMQIFGE